MSLNFFPTDPTNRKEFDDNNNKKDDINPNTDPQSGITKIVEQPANAPRKGKANVESYFIGINQNHFPHIEFVTKDRFEGHGGEIFPEIQLIKEFFFSGIDGVYQGTTKIIVYEARLEKHNHITTIDQTIFRYDVIFLKMTFETTEKMIEKRKNSNQVTDLERTLLSIQKDKDKFA